MSKLELLLKSSWSTSDIMNYLDVGRDKAIKLRDEGIRKGGSIPFKPFDVKIDSILEMFGKNRFQEISILTLITEIDNETNN